MLRLISSVYFLYKPLNKLILVENTRSRIEIKSFNFKYLKLESHPKKQSVDTQKEKRSTEFKRLSFVATCTLFAD